MVNRFMGLMCVVVVVMCFVMEEASGTVTPENGKILPFSYSYSPIRKLLERSKLGAVENFGTLVSLGGKNIDEEAVARSLRNVPSGPNPLHHNGSPRKPETP